MAYETVLFEVKNGIATVTLNRPERLNAFNQLMGDELHDIWKKIRTDDDVRAIVLRAAGDRAFCTGVDVQAFDLRVEKSPWHVTDVGEILAPKSCKVWKPFIVAVHGMCAGGAFYWLNEADIVICSEDATFFDPHVTFGMVAAFEPIGLAARLNLSEVLRIALLGNDERVSAETALRISLVTEITKRDNLWARADEIAATIAAKPPIAVQGTIRAIWQSTDLTRQQAIENAMKYPLLGNAEGTAQVDRWSMPKAKWRLR